MQNFDLNNPMRAFPVQDAADQDAADQVADDVATTSDGISESDSGSGSGSIHSAGPAGNWRDDPAGSQATSVLDDGRPAGGGAVRPGRPTAGTGTNPWASARGSARFSNPTAPPRPGQAPRSPCARRMAACRDGWRSTMPQRRSRHPRVPRTRTSRLGASWPPLVPLW